MALTDGLQAYWKFDESSGNAADATGNGNTLTNNNTTTYAAAKINNGGDFNDASTQYFDIADNAYVSIDDGWSISMWLYIDSTRVGGAGDYHYFITKRSGENGIQHWAQNDSGSWYYYIGTGTGAFSGVKINTAISTNTWYHLVVYHNGASSKAYINASSNSPSLNAITDPAVALTVGGTGGVNHTWAGKIDEVGIWNRELTQTDVNSLYNSGAGLQYPFSAPAAPNSGFLTFM